MTQANLIEVPELELHEVDAKEDTEAVRTATPKLVAARVPADTASGSTGRSPPPATAPSVAGKGGKAAGSVEGAQAVPADADKALSKQVGKRPAVDEDGHRIVLVDGEMFTVVEGDLVLDVDQKDLWRETVKTRKAALQQRFSSRMAGLGEAALAERSMATSSLIGMLQGGKLVRWSPGTVLSYCVLKNTFPRTEWYEEVVSNMQAATEAWEAVCGVQFRYVPSLDSSGSVRPAGVVFPVRHIGAGGAFIAAAFFPNDPVSRRRLLIDPSYFTTIFDRVGVLRHELGHVLGFRHEHIRSGAPAICPDEDTTGTINLTDYDPQSVMHYFCGGVGSRRLELTQVDRMGAQQLYGPPLGDFQFQDV